MHRCLAVDVIRQQGEQSLRIYRGGSWLIQVQVVQSFVEKGCKYFVFLHEERGLSH